MSAQKHQTNSQKIEPLVTGNANDLAASFPLPDKTLIPMVSGNQECNTHKGNPQLYITFFILSFHHVKMIVKMNFLVQQ